LGHDGVVKVELLVIPGCPSAEEASGLLRTALDDLGLPHTAFTLVLIDSEETARARAFSGSPAFVVDGIDLFAATETVGGMTCRVYRTPDGLRNVPALRDLRRALEQALAGTD
jgi:hypothetical protein